MLIGSTMHVQAADRVGNQRAAKVAQLEEATKQLMKSLEGYKECTFKGVCTPEQSKRLRRLGATIAALAIAVVTAGLFRKGQQAEKVQTTPLPEQSEGALNTAFAMAILQHDINRAQQLINEGASVDAKFNNMSILENVIVTKDADMVRWLLSKKAWPFVDTDILSGSSQEIQNMIKAAQTQAPRGRR